MWPIIRFNEHPPLSLSYFLSFPSTPLQLQKHRIANWICRSTSGNIILKVRGGSEKSVTAAMLVVIDWGGGVFADCLLRVQLFVSTCNRLPHLALQHHWLLPINSTSMIIKRIWSGFPVRTAI